MPYKCPEKRREAIRKSKEKYKEQYSLRDKEKYKLWRENNPVAEKEKLSEDEVKSRKRQSDRNYISNNKDKIKDYKKSYFQKHKKEILLKLKERRDTDMKFRLSCNLRSRIRRAIRFGYKSGSAVDDLGCSVEDFKSYIESKFDADMSWDNYGLYGWHLDHIKPLCSFDLDNREEFKSAVHYTNYQPLWANENWSKNRYENYRSKSDDR